MPFVLSECFPDLEDGLAGDVLLIVGACILAVRVALIPFTSAVLAATFGLQLARGAPQLLADAGVVEHEALPQLQNVLLANSAHLLRLLALLCEQGAISPLGDRSVLLQEILADLRALRADKVDGDFDAVLDVADLVRAARGDHDGVAGSLQDSVGLDAVQIVESLQILLREVAVLAVEGVRWLVRELRVEVVSDVGGRADGEDVPDGAGRAVLFIVVYGGGGGVHHKVDGVRDVSVQVRGPTGLAVHLDGGREGVVHLRTEVWLVVVVGKAAGEVVEPIVLDVFCDCIWQSAFKVDHELGKDVGKVVGGRPVFELEGLGAVLLAELLEEPGNLGVIVVEGRADRGKDLILEPADLEIEAVLRRGSIGRLQLSGVFVELLGDGFEFSLAGSDGEQQLLLFVQLVARAGLEADVFGLVLPVVVAVRTVLSSADVADVADDEERGGASVAEAPLGGVLSDPHDGVGEIWVAALLFVFELSLETLAEDGSDLAHDSSPGGSGGWVFSLRFFGTLLTEAAALPLRLVSGARVGECDGSEVGGGESTECCSSSSCDSWSLNARNPAKRQPPESLRPEDAIDQHWMMSEPFFLSDWQVIRWMNRCADVGAIGRAWTYLESPVDGAGSVADDCGAGWSAAGSGSGDLLRREDRVLAAGWAGFLVREGAIAGDDVEMLVDNRKSRAGPPTCPNGRRSVFQPGDTRALAGEALSAGAPEEASRCGYISRASALSSHSADFCRNTIERNRAFAMLSVLVAPSWLGHPVVLYPAVLAALAALLLRAYSWRSLATKKPQVALDNKKRLPGQWAPVDFKAPDPPPYPDWDVKTTKPLPYRPFKYGPNYFVTMGLRKGNFDDWIELDNEFLKFHSIKKDRIDVRGDKCCKTAPEAMDAAIELLEMLRDYLPKRYPSMFVATPVGIDNTVTGERFNIVQRPLAEEPMRTVGRLLQDDIAIMMEGPDGQYYLKSGSILLPGFWKLEEKFNMTLSGIHTSGNVPQFREKLEKGMTNFFKRIMPEEIVLRHNVDDNLAWSSSIGPEDSERTGWFTAQKSKVVESHWFRSERQSLRRLPRSGGVVFTIRTYFHPVIDIAKEPYVPGRLASALRSWGDDVATYKGRKRWEEVLLEYLDREHEKQIESGVITEDEQNPLKFPY
ncbi:hypothetical protein Dda_7984 [Drechslerella dactyloides]|uniref:Uncharacterized protein n=1 Tax=Drechslerella dactyloides TaxID=74499 RepID=A0AAD6IRB4_DREDA|nr:hypothetical protein Dda_7984 [Drechslerella dactyloides]